MTEIEIHSPTVITDGGMTELEWGRVARRRTPVVELLGLVVNQLGTELGEAEWTHGWIGLGGTARFEWASGPLLTEVLDVLLPATYDGELDGIPGLRMTEAETNWAILRWLPAPPTRLYLTRLPALDQARADFASSQAST
ncbi:hypothetical protein [Frankia sp. ACN1ag]|uniref:hypothetical protein n=1 Tax=Frankia sp. ACN1ag TaxID=102891 RepID=UPI0006DCF21C|nr:hypothetical protein [Frankia sp. ACN1ag]KQC35057.1 hypothetical protein UK82_28795 [Frankia sp. ACN1ag]